MNAAAPGEDAPGGAAGGEPVFRLERLSAEVGWMLIGAGIIGVIVPGIPGAPFLIVGAMVIVPGGKRRLSRWIGDNPPRLVRGALGQLARFVDDLENRYPRPK